MEIYDFAKILLAFVFVFVVVATFGMVAAMGVSANETANVTADEIIEDDEPDEVADQLGELIINDYEYEDGEFSILATWEGDRPTTVTLTEMIELDSEGSTSISFMTVRLIPDEQTDITIAAEERAGGTAAVMLTTPQSVDNNEAVVLQSGEPREYPAIRFGNVVLAVGATAVISGAGAFVFVLRRKWAEEHGYRRIA